MIIILNVLVIDRRIKENESLRKLINFYKEDYSLIVFPPNEEDEEDPSFQVFCFNLHLVWIFQDIFKMEIEYDKEDPGNLFDFIVHSEESNFYEVLDQNFSKINVYYLADIERLD